MPDGSFFFMCVFVLVACAIKKRVIKKKNPRTGGACATRATCELLACTNLVRWTGALYRFSSRDAIIVVGSVLEKHLGGDFTRDQEKEITFKR